MFELMPQGEYTPEQMQDLLARLVPYPHLQTDVLQQVTDNNITDPQVIAAIIHERLLMEQASVTVVNPYAALVNDMALPQFAMQDMGETTTALANNAVAVQPAAAPLPEQERGFGVA